MIGNLVNIYTAGLICWLLASIVLIANDTSTSDIKDQGIGWIAMSLAWPVATIYLLAIWFIVKVLNFRRRWYLKQLRGGLMASKKGQTL